MNNISVISLSGGLDSTSLLLHLLNKKHTVYCLTFNYGQKHKIEIEKSKLNIKYLKENGFPIEQKIIDISDSIDILSSSLTNTNEKVPTGHYEAENMKSTVVPNRNAIFSSFIYAYALSIHSKTKNNVTISLGVHSGDHAIYPDCRPDFYKKLMDAFESGNWNSKYIDLYLPYIDLNKSNIIEDALSACKNLKLNFNEIFKNTITSYEPNIDGTSNGNTGSDIERILAFNKLNLKDPLKYKYSWEDVLKTALNSKK